MGISISMAGEPYWSEHTGVDWQLEIAKLRKRTRLSEEAKTKGATKYWYYFTEDYCPVCSGTDISKERMFTPKPEDYDERHNMREVYDYCED